METKTMATVEVEAEVEEREETTQKEQVEEELVALEVESDQTENESSDSESTADAESDGGDAESSDESEREVADGGDSDAEKKNERREKIKKAVAERAKNLANDMSNAASFEAQQAVQRQVLALINYVPDFNTYQRQMNGGYLPDAVGYADTQVPESKRGLRNGLAQQLLHEQMVEMQYENLSSQ
jgi:hypothetical protein